MPVIKRFKAIALLVNVGTTEVLKVAENGCKWSYLAFQ